MGRTNIYKKQADKQFEQKFRHRTKDFYEKLTHEPNPQGEVYTEQQACKLLSVPYKPKLDPKVLADRLLVYLMFSAIRENDLPTFVSNKAGDPKNNEHQVPTETQPTEPSEIAEEILTEWDWGYCLTKTVEFFEHWRLDRYPTEVEDLSEIIKRCIDNTSLDYIVQRLLSEGYELSKKFDVVSRWFLVLKCNITVELRHPL